MAQDDLLAYPNHNKPFHIYTDISSYQVGAYSVKDNQPVAFWSCKLNESQVNNTVGNNNSFPLLKFWWRSIQCS